MSVAFLFPGQGTETPLMGGAALLRSPRVRGWLAQASGIVGLDIREAIERGLPALRRTEVAQPALTAVSLGLYEALTTRGIEPDFVAGHSVGEMAAFAAAGVYAPETAVLLAAERGMLMRAAADAAPGGMLALKVATNEELVAALAVGSLVGSIELAAENAPNEWVLSGNKSALAAVAARFPAVPLPVAGPWHSRHMADAERNFRQALAGVKFSAPRCGLVVNRNGRLADDDADLADLLAGQLTRPIAWTATLETMARLGARTWIILGPGRTLRGLVRKNLGLDTETVVVQEQADLEELAA